MSESRQLKRVLGTPLLILFGLAYMVPLVVFTTYGIVTNVTNGYLPTAYVITLIAMLFTSYSYVNMVKADPSAGSSYSYVKKTFGINVGFMVGWSLLLDYLFLPMINYMLIGIYLNAQFPEVANWVWVVAAILLVTSLNIVGIVTISGVNFVLITAQVLFLIIFFTLSIYHITQQDAPNLLSPFYGEGFNFNQIMAGAAILCLSFLGFDAISTLSEEAKNPLITIPRAIMGCTLIGGGIYIVAAYLGHLVYPEHKFANIDSAALDIFFMLGGKIFTAFFIAAYIAGCFASAIASQASVSRILFAMGRDNILPRRPFGLLHKKFHSPYLNTLLVGIISLTALFTTLEFIASMISFGALVAFSFVNLTVIKHYLVNDKTADSSLLKHGVLPSIGFLLCVWLWTSLSAMNIVVGLIWALFGLILLGVMTKGFKVTLSATRPV